MDKVSDIRVNGIPIQKIVGITCKATDKELDIENLEMSNYNFIVRGMRVSRFYKGRWQHKRHYRFKDKKENIVAIVRDLFIRNGIEISKDLDYDLGQAYLMAEGKIKGFVPRSLKKIIIKDICPDFGLCTAKIACVGKNKFLGCNKRCKLKNNS